MGIKYVYDFKEGSKEMKGLLGGKGANLAEMTNIGLPVPEGFTLTTEACLRYYEEGEKLWPDLIKEIDAAISVTEKSRRKKFAGSDDPLLFSVRSGAVVSMPGMMDTVLNLGLNDDSVEGLAKTTGNPRFAYDSYRRFIQMFSDVVCEIPKSLFDEKLEELKSEKGVFEDQKLTAEDLKRLVAEFKQIFKENRGEEFPSDPKKQLHLAVEAVFKSWNNNRAFVYRNLNDIPHDLGTAVNVQSMVFGNKGDESGTGVAFTRSPVDGANNIFGEYLINAQGEDVVAGIRTPQYIDTLKDNLPECYDQFIKACEILENHYKDMQDIEFTIEDRKLYLLQTRSGKRTANAAINVAVDMFEEGLITKDEALLRVEPKQLDQLLHPNFDDAAIKAANCVAKGLAASPGAASGKIYFTAEAAVAASHAGENVVLVRQETSPEDIEGMICSEGILTSSGGMTSHAAVVARGMGKCCVAGCSSIRISEHAKKMVAGLLEFNEGDFISINGTTGEVYEGEVHKVIPKLSGKFAQFMKWADEARRLKVFLNADNPADAKQGLLFNGEGIGLCRTEHMFFEEDRIPAVRKMILSETEEQRKKYLEELLPMQRGDFKGIFDCMEDRPVTIRLLDPPLHEFLPKAEKDIRALAQSMGVDFEVLSSRIESLAEFNPMLGHRGCRLAVTYPEIARMQARAIIEAALESKKDGNTGVQPEIMIPLVGHIKELSLLKKEIISEIDKVFEERNDRVQYLVGTMIEVPRAALTAGEIAREAEFFSFGTNDLTQMTFGLSRDDSSKFLPEYIESGIFEVDPFQTIDRESVGHLMQIATDAGLKARPDLIVGICGEHGGDPKSVEICHELGLDYVSCSPYRVPIARLAAAQAAIKYR